MKIYTKESGIHGSGIFSAKNIKKGEIICILKGDEKFKVNRNEKDSLSNPDWIGFEKNRWIDPILPYKKLNHSCSPTAAIKGKKTLIAICNIKKDSEITIDYSITEIDDLWHMNCLCKNKNCRKVIRAIQFLDKKTYNKYMPYVPASFIKFYQKTNVSK